MDIERIPGVHCATGESPFWHAGEEAWYWVDIPARRIWRMEHAGGALRSWLAPEMVACIAAAGGGGLVAGMETGIFRLQLDEDGLAQASRLAAPPEAELGEGMRFNDGRCDRQGRFWSGTMFMDMGAAREVGGLYSYSGGPGLRGPFVARMLTQNGLAWSPNGRTMYLSDSHPLRRTVWAFDYDVDSGTPHGQRVFLDLKGQKGRPDGAAVDADGCYWSCANDGGVLQRFTPAGRLDREIALLMAKPSMCAFGGPALDTLLVTSIDPGTGGDAGSVVLLRPGVQGVAETPFAG
ncbi:SMP-30/gluconolactonase/LRE family protein [Massilia sp. IC2-278]|uniref:SMP-30/gluconolactonase/LRE family protein n=1 Tax=Massilia sp. IC2-278 TaxID=2887200 RepID=UPI001E624EE8|nr:SMP-30/gluconolactonase/LRE family protein [Massilia sp. IC2-278]MCC2963555.1 SMP-30/gluconolactonase/LRE family protein [Massilia sp. IC2-278]